MTYCGDKEVTVREEFSQSYDGSCSTGEISGVPQPKPDPVKFPGQNAEFGFSTEEESDKDVPLILHSAEDTTHSLIPETAMEATRNLVGKKLISPSDISIGDASAAKNSFGYSGSHELREGEKDEEDDKGRLCVPKITENMSHESRYGDEDSEVKKKPEEEGGYHVSSDLEEDGSQHAFANVDHDGEEVLKSPIQEQEDFSEFSSRLEHKQHDLIKGDISENRSGESHEHAGNERSGEPRQEEDSWHQGPSGLEEGEHHPMINGNVSVDWSTESQEYDGKKIPENPGGEEENGWHHVSRGLVVHQQHAIVNGDNEPEKPDEEEEDRCHQTGLEEINRHHMVNGYTSEGRSEDSCEFDREKVQEKPDEEESCRHCSSGQEEDEKHSVIINGDASVSGNMSHESRDSCENDDAKGFGVIEEDNQPSGAVPDQSGSPNGFSEDQNVLKFTVTPAAILGIKFGSVDCDDILLPSQPGVSNSGLRFPGPSPIYHVNEQTGTMEGEGGNGPDGVAVEAKSGDVIGNQSEVEESLVSREGEGNEEHWKDESLSSCILDPQNAQIESEKCGFYYLIKVPRFNDDVMRERVKNAQLLVDEKTRIRDAIRSEIQITRASCKEHGDNIDGAISEEKSAREALKKKRREIDSVHSVINKVKNAISIDDIDTKIRNTEHDMEHGSLKLAEEKKLIHEIKQLKSLRGQLASHLDDDSGDLEQAFAQRDEMERQLKVLRKEAECLWDGVSRTERATKEARRGYFGEREKLNGLQSQFKEADNARQIAYVDLIEERKQLAEKNKYFRMYKYNAESAYGYAAAKNREGLQSLCINQVEKVMEEWNSNEGFREEYGRANMRSTLWRLKTSDGRALGPDEDPPAPSFPVRNPETSCLQPTPTPVEEAAPEAGEPAETADRSGVKPERRAVSPDRPEGRAEPTEEEVRQKEEEAEGRRAEEERRGEEAAVKRKEEERAKAREAQERKRRNADKARARAEKRAQKDAERREKEREKRAKKKERKKAAAEGCGKPEHLEQPERVEFNPKEEEGRPVKRAVRRNPANAVRRKTAPPPPLLLRSRGRRRGRWVLGLAVAALSALGLLLWGNGSFSQGYFSSRFGFQFQP